MKQTKILITGAAGFIGFHLAKKILESSNYYVVGLDSINDYYDVNLKTARLKILKDNSNFLFEKINLEEKHKVLYLFESHRFDYVINLAAQAGVRYSIEKPQAYIDSNITGFLNVLEACKTFPVKHLLYASSSSVYGINKVQPLSVKDSVDHPISLYAASKKANELMAHTYSHLFDLPTTGLRFFTVYGPWGRPDMALFLFTKAIIEGRPIDVYNKGKMKRDFTFVDDIVEGIWRLLDKIPNSSSEESLNPSCSPAAPYQVLNIGNNAPIELMSFIETLEKYLGKKAIKNMMNMQPGDVVETYANVDQLVKLIDYRPQTSIDEGVKKFVEWYLEYHNLARTTN